MSHSAVRTLAGMLVMTAIASVPVPAHHGAGKDDWAIWDRQAFEVCGVVEKAEFVNPHLLVHVSFTTRNGALTAWTFTALSPTTPCESGSLGRGSSNGSRQARKCWRKAIPESENRTAPGHARSSAPTGKG